MPAGKQGVWAPIPERNPEDALRRPAGGGPEGAPQRAAGPWFGGRLGPNPQALTRASAAPIETVVAWSSPEVTSSQLGVLPRAATIA